MPEFIIARCVECKQFQIKQARKDSKFACVLCCTKQSVRKVYSRSSSASALRPVVQELNMKAGMQENEHKIAEAESVAAEEPLEDGSSFWEEIDPLKSTTDAKSQWERFIPQKPVNEVIDKHDTLPRLGPRPAILSELLSDQQLVLERPERKRKRKDRTSLIDDNSTRSPSVQRKQEIVSDDILARQDDNLASIQIEPEGLSVNKKPATFSMWSVKK